MEFMKLNLKYLLAFMLSWIFVVMLLFRIIPDKKVASVVAGFGFVMIPVLVFMQQWQQLKREIFILIPTLVFFVFSALPIFLLRILNWDREFKDLSVMGVSSDFLHRSSNVLFIVMVVAVGFAVYRGRKQNN